jgi:hypothetical protein
MDNGSKITGRKKVGFPFVVTSLFFLAILPLLTPLLNLLSVLPVQTIVILACFVIAFLSFLAIYSWYNITGNLFDPYILFLSAAVLFNAGQALLEIFSLNADGLLQGAFSLGTILKTLSVVAIALASFHFGAATYACKKLFFKRNRLDTRTKQWLTDADLRTTGLILIFLSAVPYSFLMKDLATAVMGSGYFGIFQRDAPTGVHAANQVLATFLVPGALFLLAGSARRKTAVIVSSALIGGHSVLLILLGSRALGAMALLAFIWLWHRCIRLVPRTVLVSVIVALVIVFPLIHAVRGIPLEQRLSLTLLGETLSLLENPHVLTVSELGGSMATVAHTVELVPTTREYDMGLGYAYALLTALPNLFWQIHPTVERGLMSDWLIWTVDPITARLGGGLGFSFIAEAYLNFGWLGVTIFLAIVGSLVAKLILWGDDKGNRAKLAATSCFLAFFPFYARSEAAHIIRPLLWYSVLPLVLGSFVHHFRRHVFRELRRRYTS